GFGVAGKLGAQAPRHGALCRSMKKHAVQAIGAQIDAKLQAKSGDFAVVAGLDVETFGVYGVLLFAQRWRPMQRPEHAVESDRHQVAITPGEPIAKALELARSTQATLLSALQPLVDRCPYQVMQAFGCLGAKPEQQRLVAGLPMLDHALHHS